MGEWRAEVAKMTSRKESNNSVQPGGSQASQRDCSKNISFLWFKTLMIAQVVYVSYGLKHHTYDCSDR